ncbi:hypothetical protein GBF38_005335 [Nibea albiflora]|uniref:Uncharacterized protein n=1 Tax=Nibea albiflora TaxID=240163 RepID=A0ACB7EVA3_NIBAL|nr:hypothetical protein GBF38_005335 [Nibea albiflora]
MTVVADLPLVILSGGDPARTSLVDPYCGPKETDGTRVLFSFPFNSCGSTVKLGRENVSYENEIFYSHLSMNETLSNTTERVKLQCTYPLAGLHRLFSAYRFESDTVGFGKIIHTTEPLSGLQSPTIRPTVALKPTWAAKRPAGKPAAFQPAAHPPVRYRSKQRATTTLPPISNRTLHHPSFMPLYVASDFVHHHNLRTVHPIIPAEFFYTDPTASSERRIPNLVTELGPNQVVLQLSQEEDQAITNLLKLHYQQPRQTDETLTAPHMYSHPEHAQVYEPFCSDVQHPSPRGHPQQGKGWSDAELDAANTLLSRFYLMEEVNIWSHNDNTTASTLADPPPHQRHGCETDCAQHDIDYVSFSCVEESGEQGWRDFVFVEGGDADDVAAAEASSSPPGPPSPASESGTSVSGDHRTLSDSEGDAVLVLLSLGNTGSLDIVQ